MKKKIISAAMIPLMCGVGLLQSGCFGSFALTVKMHGIVSDIGPNDQIGGVIRTLIMYIGSPVWGVMGFIDVVILNLIEFWTGSNPLSMNEGELETQSISYQGKEYIIKATKNQFEFNEVEGGVVVKETYLRYYEEDESWILDENGVLTLVAYTNDADPSLKSSDLYASRANLISSY